MSFSNDPSASSGNIVPSKMSLTASASSQKQSLTKELPFFSSKTPIHPFMEGSGIVPQVHNIVCTVAIGCRLDLKRIALQVRNAEYNPKRFSAVIMRIRAPRTTALVFSSGKIVCTGAKSEDQAQLACRKYARLMQKLGFPAKFLEFTIQNIVASCDVKFPIKLQELAEVAEHNQYASYEPELFPGLIYRLIHPLYTASLLGSAQPQQKVVQYRSMVFLIFVSGKVVITGAKTREELHETFEQMYPVLKKFKKL